jgi:hypothetical protein
MHTDLGYAFLGAFGKLMNVRYAKHIFLMPSTEEHEPRIQAYLQGLLQAPSDGWVTMTHFPAAAPAVQHHHQQQQVQTRTTLILVLGAAEDIIYPPHLLANHFDARFSIVTHVIAEGQAHCFMDPGWDLSMAKPLVDWLDANVML